MSYRGILVGMTRFERATSWTQTRCASKLRHIPLATDGGIRTPRIAALETAALPVELHRYRTGDEPRIRYLQFGRLTQLTPNSLVD
jgi:hypothetical protein